MNSVIKQPLGSIRSFHARLALVAAAVLLPVLVLCSWTIWRTYENERRAIESQIVGEARAQSALVDSLIESREAVLRTLLTSRDLETGNFAGFHARAKRATPGSTEWVVLADEQGRMVVHTEFPFGTELPNGAGEYLAKNARGEDYISNLLFRGPATGQSVLFIAVPAEIGERRFSLHYVMTAHVFTEVLQRASMPVNGVAGLIDRNRNVIARSRRIEDFIGAPATPGVQAAAKQATSGKLYDRSLEGVESVIGFQTSSKTGWTAVISGPTAALFSPAREILRGAVATLIVATLGALLLAGSFASRLVRAVDALVLGTKALATGDSSTVQETGLNETDHVVRALRDAANQLRARETELARSRDEAIEASRVKDEFLATLSHELRTPLNPVLLLATDGAADPRHPPETRATFSTIAKNVSLESRLIDDMLDVTRIARGKLSLELRPVELHEVLRDALAAVELEISDKQLEVKQEISPVPIWVRADSVRLQQVLWNLLKNAAKFTPVRGKLQISTRDVPEGWCEIVVTDTGIGLSADELARGFQRFQQGAHRLGGLGLGIAISTALAELHGGTITAASPGRDLGATFTVRLPTIEAPRTTAPVLPTTGEATRASAAGMVVLLVEDHESSRIVLSRLLTRRGYEVVTAGTMAEALALFPTRVFSLLVSDIGLPDGDGYMLVKALHAIRPVVAIALSGYGMEDDIRRSHDAGFVDHVIKPVTTESLQRALTRAQATLVATTC